MDTEANTQMKSSLFACARGFIANSNAVAPLHRRLPVKKTSVKRDSGGGALRLYLYGGVWPQDWKIDPSAD